MKLPPDRFVAKKSFPHRQRVPAVKGADETTPAAVRWQDFTVGVFLILLVVAVFGQSAGFDFVNYDDDKNVYANPVVASGLSLKGIGWAFTHAQVFNWIPLTTLSHMLDCQLFGTNAGGHHLVNVLLHAATAVLLFLVLRRMTGSLWRGAFVAAVFAIHPLRAESVAWVSERKDVLSGLFFMLTIAAYVRNARQPSRIGQAAVLLFFTLGLLSKSMVVTLPFVLLLLDYWPLKRISDFRFPISHLKHLVFEKIPLLVLAAGACVAAIAPGVIITGADRLPLLERIGNAVVACVIYLRQMVFPAGLAVGYPNAPNGLPLREIVPAFILLAAISAGVFAWRKKCPALLTGWLWYLGMLFPVIGIIQISQDAAHADRYTYLPEIGLVMAVTWAVADWSAGWQQRRWILGGLMAAVIGGLMVRAHAQTAFWRDSETLWKHALACNSGNIIAHCGLGNVLDQHGQTNEAIAQYEMALKIQPDCAKARFNLGNVLSAKGEGNEAIAQYRQALEVEPDYVAARINLGHALATQGLADEAIAQYRQALAAAPDNVEARYDLAVNLARKGDLDEAVAQYWKVLEFDPADAEARNNLGAALFAKGNLTEAVAQCQQAVKIKPGYAEAHNNLGVALFRQARVDEAIAQYQQALAIQPNLAAARNNLGKALLQKGDFDGAMACFQQTAGLGPDAQARWCNLGKDFLQQKDWDGAIACYRQAIKINPRSAEACANLGVASYQKGQTQEAIDYWQRALEINPDQVSVENNLAWSLATAPDASLRNGAKAVALARQAGQSKGDGDAVILRTLAAACAETGQFPEAIRTVRRALQLAAEQKNDALASALQKELELYLMGKPLRETEPVK